MVQVFCCYCSPFLVIVHSFCSFFLFFSTIFAMKAMLLWQIITFVFLFLCFSLLFFVSTYICLIFRVCVYFCFAVYLISALRKKATLILLLYFITSFDYYYVRKLNTLNNVFWFMQFCKWLKWRVI